MKEMYKALTHNSVAQLTEDLVATATVIKVDSVEGFLEAPNLATIFYEDNFETIRYGAIGELTLEQCERGIEGTAQGFSQGAKIARYYTAIEHNAIVENIEELYDTKVSLDETGVLPIENGGTGNTIGQAVSANSLATGRTIQTDLTLGTATVFDGTSNVVIGVTGVLPVENGGTGSSTGSSVEANAITGVLPIENGGTGNTIGQAVSANSLATGRTIQANLASNTATMFDGTSNIIIGITGILPVENGGTGTDTGSSGGSSDLIGETGANHTQLGQGAAANSNSIALGLDAIASGRNSIVLGRDSSVSSNNGIALGRNSSVIAINSITIGMDSIASGNVSMALGTSSSASGYRSIVLGSSSSAIDINCISIGGNSQSIASNSAAIGTHSATSGEFSLAIGYAPTSTSTNCISIGRNCVAGAPGSIAIGAFSEALGNYGVALGFRATIANTSSNTIQLGNSSGLSTLSCKVALTVTSDERDKTDIEPVINSLEFLSKIETVTYKFNHRSDYAPDIEEDIDLLEEKQRKYQEAQSRVEELKDIPETIKDEETGEMILNPDYDVSTISTYQLVPSLTEEEQSELEEKRARREKRNMYGLADYDKEAHAKGIKKRDRQRVGVLAQQVRSAMIAEYGTDNYADILIDNMYNKDESEIPEGVENILGVNYGNFTPFLIDGVKRLYLQNQQLESLINNLQAQNTLLENRLQILENK